MKPRFQAQMEGDTIPDIRLGVAGYYTAFRGATSSEWGYTANREIAGKFTETARQARYALVRIVAEHRRNLPPMTMR